MKIVESARNFLKTKEQKDKEAEKARVELEAQTDMNEALEAKIVTLAKNIDNPRNLDSITALLENTPDLNVDTALGIVVAKGNVDAALAMYPYLAKDSNSYPALSDAVTALSLQELDESKENPERFNQIAKAAISSKIQGAKEFVEEITLPQISTMIESQNEKIDLRSTDDVLYEDLAEQFGEEKASMLRDSSSIELVSDQEFDQYLNARLRDSVSKALDSREIDFLEEYHLENRNKIVASKIDQDDREKLQKGGKIKIAEEVYNELTAAKKEAFLSSFPILSENLEAESSSREVLDFALSKSPDSFYLEKFTDLIIAQTPEDSKIRKDIAAELKKEITTPAKALDILSSLEKLEGSSLSTSEKESLAIFADLTRDYTRIDPTNKSDPLSINEIKELSKANQILQNNKTILDSLKDPAKDILSLATIKYLDRANEVDSEFLKIATSQPKVLEYYKKERRDWSLPVAENFSSVDFEEHISFKKGLILSEKSPSEFNKFLDSKPPLGKEAFAKGTLGKVAIDNALDNIGQHPEIMEKLIDLTQEQYGKETLKEQIATLDKEFDKSEIDQVISIVDKHYKSQGDNAELIMELASVENEDLSRMVLENIKSPFYPDIQDAIESRINDKFVPIDQKIALNNVLVEKLHSRPILLDAKMLEKLHNEEKYDQLNSLLLNSQPSLISGAIQQTNHQELIQYVFKNAKNYEIASPAEAEKLVNLALNKKDDLLLAEIVTKINSFDQKDKVVSSGLFEKLHENNKTTEIEKLFGNISSEAMVKILAEAPKSMDINTKAVLIEAANILPGKSDKLSAAIDKVTDEILSDPQKIAKLNDKSISILAQHYDSLNHNPSFLVKLIDTLDDKEKKPTPEHIANIQNKLALAVTNPHGKGKTDSETIKSPEFNEALQKYLNTKRSFFKALFRDQNAKIEKRTDTLRNIASQDHLSILQERENQAKNNSFFFSIMTSFISPLLSVLNKDKTSDMLKQFQVNNMEKLLKDLDKRADEISPTLAAKIYNQAIDIQYRLPQEEKGKIKFSKKVAEKIFKNPKAVEKLGRMTVNELAQFYEPDSSKEFVSKLVDANYSKNISKEELYDIIQGNREKGGLGARIDGVEIDEALNSKRHIFNPMKFREESSKNPSTHGSAVPRSAKPTGIVR